MEDLWPGVIQWPEGLYILKDPLHKKYQGRDIETMLKHVPRLVALVLTSPLHGSPRCKMMAGIALVEALIKLKTDTFETDPSDQFQRTIKEFECAWKSTGMPITTKCHYVIHGHLAAHIERTGFGIGPWSTQGAEHFHGRLEKFVNLHLVKDAANPIYKEKLLQSVGELCAENI